MRFTHSEGGSLLALMRRARIVVPGFAHHITQRGNRRTDVFCDAEDRFLYLELLREYSTSHRLRLWAYSLMTNHVHLVAVPETESALSTTMRDTHAAYASMFNRKYGFTGHLWQARFYSCVLGDEHLWHAVRYVERNPVRARIVDRAEDYPWSSAATHVMDEKDRYLDEGLPLVGTIENWSEWLAGEDSGDVIQGIRDATSTGRACGSEDFIDRLESQYGCSFRPGKAGRKARSSTTAESITGSSLTGL